MAKYICKSKSYKFSSIGDRNIKIVFTDKKPVVVNDPELVSQLDRIPQLARCDNSGRAIVPKVVIPPRSYRKFRPK